MSFVQATPRRRQSTTFGDPAGTNANGNNIANNNASNLNNNTTDDPLAQSLRQLSLSTGTPTKSKSPSPLSRTSTAGGPPAGGPRSPSVAGNRRNSTTPRSPLPNGRESRTGTPGLLRKASMNSLHSGSSINGGSPSKGLTRRTSASNLKSPSPGTPLRSPMLGSGGHGFETLREERQRPPRPPPPTAADIARSHFQAELARHSNRDEDLHHSSSTVVILQDACYGHRFSRPRTSRANLSTIVERPERIQACAVGVSAAYVRLGGRHADGEYMPHPQLDPRSIPRAAVPFRIHKTSRALPLQSPAVTNVHGTKWMEELKTMCDAAETKLALNGKELQRPDMDRGPPHHHATPARLHEGDLYLCAESLQALEGALGGVCEAVDAVFDASSQNRRAFVAIRPPGHHCSADWPSGFCWINNVHVGIMHAILAHGLTHAAIVDIDLHHGDGSQAIAWQHNARSASATKNTAAWKKTSIGYFSLHDINSFPCESGDEDKVKNASLCIENAHGQTVWNVHLEPWKSEAAFWALYAGKYAALLDKLRAFFHHQAAQRGEGSGASNGAIFISAGFDASEWETSSMQRHKVNVPTEFYARFTRDVVQIANDECAGRIVSVLEGGYSDRALFSGVLSHVSGLAGSDPVTTRDEAFQSGLGYEMGSRLGALGINGNAMQEDSKPVPSVSGAPYDPAWWASAELDQIEAAIAPPPPPPEPKADRTPHPSTTYSSPTASSQAKVVYTPKLRRSMSGLSAAYGGSGLASSPSSRPPSPPPPPPPEVPWTTAMHELSKLLIPTEERTTTSCTAEDLSAEATRARRDRQILLGTIDVAVPAAAASCSTPATPSGPTRVSMRERKQVKPFGSSVAASASTSTAIKEEDPELDRKNRRKTIGGAVSATAMPVASTGAGTRGGRPKQTGRRLSAASTVVPKDDFDLPPVPAVPTVLPSSVGVGGAASSTGSSTRPTSAHSSSTTAARPDSSMSGAPLSVRKARPAAGTAGKTPRKKAAATTTTTSTTTTTKPPYSRKTSSSSAATTASTAPTNDDLDKLTSGMRKIKINVVTTAQKEAREKAKRGAAEKQKQAMSSRESSVDYPVEAAPVASTPLPKKLVDTSASASTVALPSTPLAQTIGAAPTLCFTEAVEPPPAGSSLSVDTAMAASSIAGSDDHSPLLTPSIEGGLGSSDPLASSLVGFSGVSAPAAAPAPTVFIPYQPDSTPQQPPRLSSSAAAPLHWLPPNEVHTPMAMAATRSPMKRADLPVFTSTSAIPFFGGGAASSSSRPSSAGLSVALAAASASSRPATSSGAGPAPSFIGTLPSTSLSSMSASTSPTMRPRSPTKLPRSPTKSPRKTQN